MIRDGIYYGLGFTAAGLFVLWFAGPWSAFPFFLMGAFCAWFFRDPERPIPVGPVALSPADGRVMAVVRSGPAHSNQHLSEYLRRSREPFTYIRGDHGFHVSKGPVSGRQPPGRVSRERAEHHYGARRRRDESCVQTNRGIDCPPHRVYEEARRFRASWRTGRSHQVRLASGCHLRPGVARRGFSGIARYAQVPVFLPAAAETLNWRCRWSPALRRRRSVGHKFAGDDLVGYSPAQKATSRGVRAADAFHCRQYLSRIYLRSSARFTAF